MIYQHPLLVLGLQKTMCRFWALAQCRQGPLQLDTESCAIADPTSRCLYIKFNAWDMFAFLLLITLVVVY